MILEMSKKHFPGSALGTDEISAAYHLVCPVSSGSNVGYRAGECKVKVDELQYTDGMTEGGVR